MRAHLTLSCVIPVFNGERFLGEAIESVLAQSYRPSEIIVVNDGSTDATKAVAARFAEHVAYVEQSNAGPASARNRGIQSASGDFIAFLDSDDLWHPEKTAIQLAHFAARSELVLCTAQMQNFWSAQLAHEAASLADTRLAQIQPNVGSTLIARRSLFQTIGLLDPAFRHRDIQELILRAAHNGLATEALPDVLVQRRIHDANLSRNRSEAGDLELLLLARTRMMRRRNSPT